MKFGMNLLLWTGLVNEDLYPVMADLKAAGFDGVEIPLFEGDDAHYKTLRQELDKQGLGCTTVTVLSPETNAISPDKAVREASLERLKQVIGWNHILGSTHMCGPFQSPLGVFTGEGPTDDEKARAAEVLRQAADVAKAANLMLAIEYLNRFECYFLNTAVDARKLVRAVDHSNFRTMYDTFHAHIEEKDQAEAIHTVADVVTHVHISENDRGTPGTGQVHWDSAFQALRDIHYDGWMTIEAFGRALPALAAATRVWRDLFPSPKEVYMQGLSFMKEKWQATAKK